MRIIKFRGKRIDNKEWVIGFLDYNPIECSFLIHEIGDIPPTWNEPGGDIYTKRFEIIPETIGQFTGLKDKNGKEIYGGDTLRGFQKEQKDKTGEYGFDITDTVHWIDGGFKVFGKDMQSGYTRENNILYQFMWCNSGHFATPDYYYQLDDIEIIGNIHDEVKTAAKDSVTDTMMTDPRDLQPASEEVKQDGGAEVQPAEPTESEEGGTEG